MIRKAEPPTPERLEAMKKQCTFIRGEDMACDCWSPEKCKLRQYLTPDQIEEAQRIYYDKRSRP